MKTLTKIRVGFVSAAAALMCFSSCSTDDNLAGGSGAASMQEGVVLLSINTGQMGTRATGGTTPLNDQEKMVNDMTIGIFDANTGIAKTIKTFKGAGTGADVLADGKIYTDGKKSKVKIVSSTLKATDKVLVAVNTADDATAAEALLAAKNVTEFNKVSLASENIVKLANANKLPKYGEGSLKATSTASEYEADITVKNLVSRVTLENLTINMEGAYKNATFTLDKIYLTHVPAAVDYSKTGWTLKTFTPATDKYIHGISAKAQGPVEMKDFLKKAVTQAGLDQFLYTTPNEAVDDDKTTLVLAGQFDMKDGSPAKTIYYPLALNAHYDETTHKYVKADDAPEGVDLYKTRYGMNYKCSVTIKTIGTDDPWELLTPQTATISVEVADWLNVTQTSIFQ